MIGGRAAWFVAGTAAGVYASVKARRAAYRVSMPGLIDQASALGEGWRAFNAEVREAMGEEQRRMAHRLEQNLTALPPATGPDDTAFDDKRDT